MDDLTPALDTLPITPMGNVPSSTGLAAGPLNETSLLQLANQMFAALPGHAAPNHVSLLSSSPPVITPQHASAKAPADLNVLNLSNDVTDTDIHGHATQPPTTDGLFDIPSLFAPALPQVDATHTPFSTSRTPAHLPTSPFYFVGEAVALAATHQSMTGTELSGLPDADSLSIPHLPEVPSATELQHLLATQSSARAEATPKHPSSESFYFLHASQPLPTAQPATATHTTASIPFDINLVRRDFPILSERINGRQLIWLDNAATTHKPQAVIDRLAYFYAHENSNIHRAAHELAARATDAYEGARNKVARFLGAKSVNEIIFVRGATEGINLIAQTFGKQFINAGDEIIVSHLEHHANIVPWQMLAKQSGARLRVIPVDDDGQLLLSDYQKLLNERTRLVAVTQVSNALGTITPIKQIIELAHRAGAKVLVDGAQAVSHLRVNVQALDADFYVFSGHKVFAPTGIGVVYGKQELLEQLPPYQGGGNMISDVTFERTSYHGAPTRFEAGTGNIADAVGLGAALDYIERLGMHNIARYEHELLAYATHGLTSVPGLKLIGTARDKASVLSFVLDGYSTEEVGKALNQEGIAVRSGHHCAQPILRRFGLEATVRPSLAFYNTCAEVDTLISVLKRLTTAKSLRNTKPSSNQ